MSLRGVIRRPDKAPLGTIADIQSQLSEAFPGVRFVYDAEEPKGSAQARKLMPIYLRIWLSLFGVDGRYPCYRGYFVRSQGGGVEFYFEATEPVRSVSATSYGMTSGLDTNFDRLEKDAGWIVRYPRF